jgi:hypothetical protein
MGQRRALREALLRSLRATLGESFALLLFHIYGHSHSLTCAANIQWQFYARYCENFKFILALSKTNKQNFILIWNGIYANSMKILPWSQF